MPIILALANKVLNVIGFEEMINNSVEWDRERWSVTPGALLKSVILSTFLGVKVPLSKVKERFAEIAIEALLGEGINLGSLNDSEIGRAMDRFSEAKPDTLFSKICLNAMVTYRIAFQRLHSDTTTVSFYGEYETEEDVEVGMEHSDAESDKKEEEEKVPVITKGYNKDHKPECKQVVVGKMVTEHGIPVAVRNMDGNTADVDWNAKALEMAGEIFSENSKGVYIADSKLMTEENFKRMSDPAGKIRFISRCPSNFAGKIEKKMIGKAYEDGEEWTALGKIAPGERACEYWGKEYTENLWGYECRFVVIKSSEGEARFEAKKIKYKEGLEKEIKDVCRKEFVCKADAEKEWQRFMKGHKDCIYDISVEYTETVQKLMKRGRPGKNSKPVEKKSIWKLNIHILGESVQNMAIFRQSEESFVLATNTGLPEMTMRDVLAQYKGQMAVEIDFRYFKEPSMASVIFLKKPERVQVLLVLLSIALLVRALVQYKLRKGRKEYVEEEVLRIGSRNRKMPDNPTFAYFSDLLSNVYFERVGKGNYTCSFLNDREERDIVLLLDFVGYTVEELFE